MHTTRRPLAQVLDLVEGALAAMEADRSGLSHAERLDAVVRARRLRDQLASLTSVLVREAEAAQSSMVVAGTPMTTWLAISGGIDTRDAAADIFTARRLTTHPIVRDAALSGEVSAKHADAITRGMAHLPPTLSPEQQTAAEASFITRSHTATPRKVEQLAPLVLAEVAPELVPSPDDQSAALDAQTKRARGKRSFTWGDDGDGSTWFHGSLPHLDAAPLVTAVEAYVEAERRTARDHKTGMRELRPGPRLLREASAAVDVTPDQRRADALARLIADHRGIPTTAGDRPRIVVTITEASLRDRAEQAGILGTGAQISAGDLRRLCCDADLMPVVLGGASEVLDVGRTQRLVTPAIRRALTLRDGGCIFPNCHQPDARCEAHHVHPWWAGGETTLSNLVLLCAHHHAVIEPQRFNPTADQWTIHWQPDGTPQIRPPSRWPGTDG